MDKTEPLYKINCHQCGKYIKESKHEHLRLTCYQCYEANICDDRADREYGHRVNGSAKAWC